MTTEVKVFRTVQGLDYIGELESESDTSFRVKRAMAVRVHEVKGQAHVSFGLLTYPFLANYGEDKYLDIDLNRSAVLFVHDPEEELEKNYRNAVTGIELVNKLPSNM